MPSSRRRCCLLDAANAVAGGGLLLSADEHLSLTLCTIITVVLSCSSLPGRPRAQGRQQVEQVCRALVRGTRCVNFRSSSAAVRGLCCLRFSVSRSLGLSVFLLLCISHFASDPGYPLLARTFRALSVSDVWRGLCPPGRVRARRSPRRPAAQAWRALPLLPVVAVWRRRANGGATCRQGEGLHVSLSKDPVVQGG